MAVSTSYVVRETASNLRRNLVMTVAAIVTMCVSLTALAAVLLMRQAVNSASIQWRGGVQVAVFMDVGATPAETAAVAEQLKTMPGVKKTTYVDQTGALKEFRQIFAGDPDFVSVVTAADLPASFRIVPTNAANVNALGAQFAKQPGVKNVEYAAQEIDTLLSHFRQLRIYAYAIAGAVMLGAIALIVNTIQLAIFARRREVAVMKLVGATNWFIRVPFMIEGLIHGLVGALAAFGAAFFIRTHLSPSISSNLIPGNNPYVSPGATVATGIVVIIVGAAVGVLGSAFAIRRFLAV
jgi:cell division transport system permease protein